MAVRARRRVSGVGQVKYEVSASDIMKSEHPVNAHFVRWLNGAEPTKRKARRFLSQYPQYRGK